LADFKSQGGVLGGREERTDAFEGEPRQVGATLSGKNGGSHNIGGHGAEGTTSLTEKDGHHSHHHHDTTESGLNGTTTGNSTGLSGSTTTSSTTGTGKKPSLMDKINPKIDSNGDGKAGFMK
jgi:hypothetical protein